MRKRSILKALSWELISNTIGFGVAYLFFGNIGNCLIFTVVMILTKLVLFYYHDLLWSGTRIGK